MSQEGSPEDGSIENTKAESSKDEERIIRITLLTQVKINFRPGIKPGTQRLGVQYTRHQAITQDKSLSPHSFLCILPVAVGESANLTLADPPNLVPSEPL